ncbi:MAG: hypothetical protein ACRDJ2_12820 [Actinomycetota bacterium]
MSSIEWAKIERTPVSFGNAVPAGHFCTMTGRIEGTGPPRASGHSRPIDMGITMARPVVRCGLTSSVSRTSRRGWMHI